MFLTEPGLQGSCHRWGEKTVDKNSLSQASNGGGREEVLELPWLGGGREGQTGQL